MIIPAGVAAGRPFGQVILPSVVYHGSDHQFTRFNPGLIGRCTGADTAGFWFSSSARAAHWFGEGIMEIRLSPRNPWGFINSRIPSPPEYAREGFRRGFDLVGVQDVFDGDSRHDVWCCKDPDLITIIRSLTMEEIDRLYS